MKLPQKGSNFEVLDKEMRINIIKFHKFMKTVVNPVTVVSLIESLDSVLMEDVKLITKKEEDAFRAKKSQSVIQKRSRSI